MVRKPESTTEYIQRHDQWANKMYRPDGILHLRSRRRMRLLDQPKRQRQPDQSERRTRRQRRTEAIDRQAARRRRRQRRGREERQERRHNGPGLPSRQQERFVGPLPRRLRGEGRHIPIEEGTRRSACPFSRLPPLPGSHGWQSQTELHYRPRETRNPKRHSCREPEVCAASCWSGEQCGPRGSGERRATAATSSSTSSCSCLRLIHCRATISRVTDSVVPFRRGSSEEVAAAMNWRHIRPQIGRRSSDLLQVLTEDRWHYPFPARVVGRGVAAAKRKESPPQLGSGSSREVAGLLVIWAKISSVLPSHRYVLFLFVLPTSLSVNLSVFPFSNHQSACCCISLSLYLSCSCAISFSNFSAAMFSLAGYH